MTQNLPVTPQKNGGFNWVRNLEAVLAVAVLAYVRYVQKGWGWTWYQTLGGIAVVGTVLGIILATSVALWGLVFGPASTLLHDEGIVGLGRYVYQNLVRVILYGKREIRKSDCRFHTQQNLWYPGRDSNPHSLSGRGF